MRGWTKHVGSSCLAASLASFGMAAFPAPPAAAAVVKAPTARHAPALTQAFAAAIAPIPAPRTTAAGAAAPAAPAASTTPTPNFSTAPVAVEKFERAGPAAAALASTPPACTTTFTGAQDLSWGNLNNWTGGAVPGSGDVVCVTGSAVPSYNATSSIVALNAPSGLTLVGGQLILSDTTPGEGSTVTGLSMSAGRLSAAGALTITGTSSANGIIDAATLDLPTGSSLSAPNLTINPASTTLVVDSHGALTVPDAGTLTVNGTFKNGTGSSIAGAGTGAATVSVFDETTGTTTGTPVNVVDQLHLTGLGASSFAVPPNHTVALTGNIGPNQTVSVIGLDGCGGSFPATLTATSFTVHGHLNLVHSSTCGGGTAALQVSGIATIASDGTFTSTGPNPAVPMAILGNVVNQGTAHFDGATTTFGTSGATWTNAGSLDLTAGSILTFSPGTFLVNAASGTVSNHGTFYVDGDLTQGDGTAPGEGQTALNQPGPYNDLQLRSGSVVHFTGTGVAGLAVPPNNGTTFTGAIAPGQRLTAIGLDGCGGSFPASVTSDPNADVSSAGTIELRHSSTCGGGNAGLVVAPGHTLTSTGLIKVDGENGPHSMAGTIISSGQYVQTVGALSQTGDFTNQGTFTMAAGTTFTGVNGSTFRNGQGGSMALAKAVDQGPAAADFTHAGTFLQGAGTTDPALQPVNVVNTLTFTGEGHSSFVVPPNHAITLSGDMVAGQVLTVVGLDSCGGSFPGTANVVEDMVSAGDVHLTHSSTCGGGTSFLNVAAGKTFTNVGHLFLDGEPSDLAHLLGGTVVNEGTMNVVSGKSALAQAANGVAAGSLINLGSLTVASPATLSVPAGTSFTNGQTTANGPTGTPISVQNDGILASAGTVWQGAGTTTGNPVMVSGTMAYTGSGASHYEVPANSTLALSGNVSPNQALTIVGHDSCGGSFPGTVNATGSFTNAGTVELFHSSTCAGGQSTLVIPSGATFTNLPAGVVVFGGNGAGPHELIGDFTNQGTVSALVGESFYRTAGTTWHNAGVFEVGPSAGFTFGPGANWSMDQGGSVRNLGVLTSSADIVQGKGTALGAAQTLPGQPGPYNDIRLVGGSIDYTDDGAGAFAVQPGKGVDLSGDMHPGQRLTAVGLDSCGGSFPATITTAGSVTAGGVIELYHSSTCIGGPPTLVVSPGTVLNNTGTLLVDGEGGIDGPPHVISGSITNLGLFDLKSGQTHFNGPGSLVNGGSVVVEPNARLFVHNGVSIANVHGNMAVDGTLQSESSFTEGAGSTSGLHPVTVSSGSLNYTGAGPSEFFVPANTSITLTGDLSPGQHLEINGLDSCGGGFPATATGASSFTNGGTITIHHESSCAGGVATLAVAPGGVITNTGTIEADTEGGPTALTGDVDNQGALNVLSGVFTMNGVITNAGTVNVAAAATLNATSLTQTPTGRFNVNINGAPNTNAFSHLNFTDPVVLDGFVNVLQASNYAAVDGDAFPFLTHPSETGTFRRVHGQVTPTQAFAAAYAPTHDDLVVGPSDLHVALSAHDVTAPAAAVGPGHQVTADFQVTSSGPDTAPNPWTDSIYISSDTVFDPADVLLQRVEHQTDLDANASYAVPIGAFLPALAPGQYHLIVVPDSGGRVSFSALNTNGVSPAFDVIEPPLLTPGTPISTTVAKGQDAYYRLNVTSIDDITVTLTPSVDGSVDLLAAAARFATPADHDRLSSKAVGPESFIATQSKAGVWFIDLHGNASAGAIPGSNVVLSAAESGLTVSRTTPSSGSNKGQVTIDLEGSDFGPDLVLKLAQSGTPMRTATSVARTDSTIAFGTFDLQGLAVGVYDLVLASEGRTFTKPSAFTVNDGPGGQLRLNATAPDSIRFGWPGSVDVTLTNTGGTDVLVPIVRLTATLNDVVAPPGSTEFGPSADVVDPDFASGSSSPLPRSVLPPGQSSTLHFQVKSTSNEAHSRLNTQAQAVSTAATTPIDWPSQLASAQPTGLSNSAWSTVVASLASLLGPTQDAYAKRLVQTITEADQFDVAFKNEAQVLDYIVQRQLATDPAAPVSGTLYLDDTSHPLSRVAMSLGDPGGDSLLNAISWYDGRFAFWDVPASPQPLHAAGYLPRPAVVVDPSPTATGLSVVVDPGATVTGTVLGSGAPVADAVVSVADGAGSVQSAPTGADGAYTVTGLAPGSVTAQATGPGFLASGPASASVTLVGPNALDLSLTTGGTITGTITDVGGTDPPPAGTTVKANPTDHSGPPIAGTVKADGTYTIAGLPALAGPDPHSYTVTAEAPDHGSASHSGVLAALDATTSGVDIELATAGSLAGHVTDAETGLPIQGVVVSTDGPGTHKPTTTNLTGDYTLAGLPAGPQHVLFSPPDREHIPLNLPVTVNGGAPPTVQDAAIAPSGTVAINVQNTAGDPLPQQALALISPVHTNADGEYVQGLATDAGGHATASRLLPGSYEVQVLGADVHVPFSISGGAPHPAVTVTVPAGLLQGTVRHTDNSPAAGVAVAVSDAQRQVMTTTTDADGHYALRVNGAQTLDVVATGKGFGLTMALAQTVPADGTTTVDLSPGTGSLTVTVTSGGKPVKDAWVSAFSGPANVQPAAVDAESGADGVAVLNGLSPGTYRVTVATPGRGTTSQSVVVNAGNNPLPVSMGLAGSIAGRVTHAGGDVSNAIVRVGSASGLAKSAVTDGTGHYTVNDLAPGDYDVSVVDGADAPARFTGVAVLAGGTTVRDATLSTAGSTLTVLLQSGPGGLPGRELAVFDASGAQVAGGALGPAASSASPATTLVAGPLADGTYTVVVSGPGAATAKQVVVLPAAGPIAVAAPAGEVLFAGPQVASQFPSAASVSGALKALGAVRPRAAADTPQITVSGADLVASWLGGDLFPPPRQSVLEPFETQRFHHALAMSIDPKCPDYARLKAMQDQLKHLFRAMVESFDAWLLAYQSMKETGSADLIIAANNIIQVANAGIQTAVSLSGPAASMLAQLDNAVTSRATAVLSNASLALSDVTNAIGALTGIPYAIVGAVSNAISSPSTAFDFVLSNLNILNNAAAPFIALAGESWPGAGIASSILNLIANMRSAWNDLQTAFGNANAALHAALQAESTYKRAIDGLDRALTAFEQAKFDSYCPPPPPPPDPPPPPPGPDTSSDNHLPGDPNDILGPGGFGPERWLAGAPPLSYLVEFQNDPKIANAPAVEVTVQEIVPDTVDPDSVELTGFGFGQTVVTIPSPGQSFSQRLDLRSTIGDFVDATGTFDKSTRTITWVITTINPETGDIDTAPDAGFLPVDNDQGDGEGFVSWRGQAVSGLAQGTTIPAVADIVFDRNPAISTPTWSNSIDPTGPSATVAALPASSPIDPLSVTWSGDDGEGSGVATFDVYSSVDGAAFTLWKSATTATTDTFAVAAGHTYGFTARAVDNVANADPGAVPPTVAQASTHVVAASATGLTSTANPSVPGQAVVFSATVSAAGGDATPTGSVTFTDGLAVLCPAVPLVGGQAACSTAALVAGPHVVGAAYSGDNTFGSSASTPLTQVVSAGPGSGGGAGAGQPALGYWLLGLDGGVFAFGQAGYLGSTLGKGLVAPVAGMASTPSGRGYWVVAKDGGVFAFGDAGFFGSIGGVRLNGPIVGVAAAPDGLGYWLVGADGGVFAFGSARFFGSALPTALGAPLKGRIVGMVASPSGLGYWLVGSDGGVFAFGDAGFFGSIGGLVLRSPIVGMAAAPDGLGYWLVGADGGVFAIGPAGYFGNAVGRSLNGSVVGMASSPTGRGYWLLGSDGGVFAQGDAGFFGSFGGGGLNAPALAIVPRPQT